MIEVEIVNHTFVPEELRIAPGTEVAFRNDDPVPHTVTADDDSFDSGEIGTGSEYHYTFDSPGECGLHCELHPEMKMKVIVE